MIKRAAARSLHLPLLLVAASGCAPDIPTDPVPEAMEFDLTAVPARAPQPSSLLVNPVTGRIDFSLAHLTLPSDCGQALVSPAECEFDHWLETLDGFPTLSALMAPITAEPDPATLRDNVVMVAAKSQTQVTDLDLGYDASARAITVRPTAGLSIGEFYWVGVRGYADGVRAANGSEVVGSPIQLLLEQDEWLTCGASEPQELSPSCPALAVVAQNGASDAAAASLFQLEAVRQGYIQGGAWDLLGAYGLHKRDAAVVWGFPTHSASVAELDPSSGRVPQVDATGVHIAVKGSVEPTTLTPYVLGGAPGSVVLVDASAALAGDAAAAFPPFSVSYADGAIALAPGAPPTAGHVYAVLLTDAISDASGVPLVASPVSVFLTVPDPLVDANGRSTVSSLSDEQATLLEMGRQQLAALLDDPAFAAATGVTRERVVYAFAFEAPEAP